MKMKWGALLLVLAMAATLVSACTEQDPTKIVVAEVNGQKIYKSEAQQIYDWLAAQTIGMYARYGETIDPANATFIADMKTYTLGIVTDTAVMEQKLEALGIPLSEAELEQIITDAQEEYRLSSESLQAYGLDEAGAEQELLEMGYPLQAFEYMFYTQLLDDRLMEYATADVTVSDEEVSAEYAEHVAAAEEGYAATPSSYVDDVIGGATIFYHPADFRYVKNLVIDFEAETAGEITSKSDENSMIVWLQAYAQNELDTATDLTDERKAEIEAEIEGYNQEIETLAADLETLRSAGFEAILPKAEEILAQAKAEGADFDALMDEFNADEPTGVTKEMGYPVATGVTNYVQEFTDGAMALENVGDVSDLIQTTYGYHILKYTGDVPVGPVPLEDVAEVLEHELLEEKRNTLFQESRAQWLEDAKINTYINRF